MHKAVVPVAGLGTRFWPASAALPKEMLPLVDRPLVDYAVDEALRAGLSDVLFITSRTKRAIEDHFDIPPEMARLAHERGLNLNPWGQARFHFVRQQCPLGLGHAVGLADVHIGRSPFVVLLPDDIVVGPPDCLRTMMRLAEQTGRSVVAVRRVDPELVGAYGVIRPGSLHAAGVFEVEDLVEKPAPGAAPSNLAILGRYVLTPSIFACLRAAEPSAGGEIQLTDALRALNRQHPILAYEFPGQVFDAGSKAGFLEATVELAMAHPDLGPAFSTYIARRARDLAPAYTA